MATCKGVHGFKSHPALPEVHRLLPACSPNEVPVELLNPIEPLCMKAGVGDQNWPATGRYDRDHRVQKFSFCPRAALAALGKSSRKDGQSTSAKAQRGA